MSRNGGVKRKLFGRRDKKDCHYCGTSLTFEQATVDHTDGKGTACVIACQPCNVDKGAIPYGEYVTRGLKS